MNGFLCLRLLDGAYVASESVDTVYFRALFGRIQFQADELETVRIRLATVKADLRIE